MNTFQIVIDIGPVAIIESHPADIPEHPQTFYWLERDCPNMVGPFPNVNIALSDYVSRIRNERGQAQNTPPPIKDNVTQVDFVRKYRIR